MSSMSTKKERGPYPECSASVLSMSTSSTSIVSPVTLSSHFLLDPLLIFFLVDT